jgi:hypothetical protein
MDKEYLFHCRGCKKPDKEFPLRFDDYEYDEPIYNAPRVTLIDALNAPKVSEHMWARVDAYGIYTGLYCDKCYVSNYPYRKDRYHDEAYCGERMNPDE